MANMPWDIPNAPQPRQSLTGEINQPAVPNPQAQPQVPMGGQPQPPTQSPYDIPSSSQPGTRMPWDVPNPAPPQPQTTNQPSQAPATSYIKAIGAGVAKGAAGIGDILGGPDTWFRSQMIHSIPGMENEPIPPSMGELAEKYVPGTEPGTPQRTVEETTKGGVMGAPFGPASIIGGAVGSAVTETLNQSDDGAHPVRNAVAGLIASIAAAPVTNILGKAARSIPEMVGAFPSSINRTWSAIGGPRIAGMSSESAFPTQVQNALREAPGGGRIAQTEEKVFNAIEQYAVNVADRLGPDLTKQEFGTRIASTAQATGQSMRAEVGRMSVALGNVVQRDYSVIPQHFEDAVRDIAGKYTNAEELRGIFQQGMIERIQNSLSTNARTGLNPASITGNIPAEAYQRITPNIKGYGFTGTQYGPLVSGYTPGNIMGAGLPYNALQNIRTDVGEMIEKGTFNPSVNVKELRRLYSALSLDMREAYPTMGGKRAFDAVNSAQERLFNTLETRIQPWSKLGIEPELLADRMTANINKGGTRLNDLIGPLGEMSRVDPELYHLTMGYTLRKLGEDRLGDFNPARLVDNLKKMSPEARALFPKETLAGIDLLSQAAGLSKESFRSMNTSHTAGNTFLLDMTAKVADHLGRIGAVGLGMGTMGASARHFSDDYGMVSIATQAGGLAGIFLTPVMNAAAARLWTNHAFNTWLGTEGPDLSKKMALLGGVVAEAPELSMPVEAIARYITDTGIAAGKGVGNFFTAPDQNQLQQGEKPRYAGGGLVDQIIPQTYMGGGYAGWPDQSNASYRGGGLANHPFGITNQSIPYTSGGMVNGNKKMDHLKPADKYAQGGLAQGGPDPRPFYNPQLPGVSRADGGYVSEKREDELQVKPLIDQIANYYLNDFKLWGNKSLWENGDPVINKSEPNLNSSMRTFKNGGHNNNPEKNMKSGGLATNYNLGGSVSRSTGGVVDNILKAEGTGKNPNSSASGVGQFIDSTWDEMIRKYHPEISDPKSVRGDDKLGKEMTIKYAQENAQTLKSHGIDVTPSNVYLAHFLGPEGALRVLTSNDATPLAAAVDSKAMAANKFLSGMSVADIKAWAERKMGQDSDHTDIQSNNQTLHNISATEQESPSPDYQYQNTQRDHNSQESESSKPPKNKSNILQDTLLASADEDIKPLIQLILNS